MDRTTGHAPDPTLEEWDATKQALYTYLQTYGSVRVIDLMAEFDLSYEQVQRAMGELRDEHPDVQPGRWTPSYW